MAITLDIPCQYGATCTISTRLKRLSFGDGYEQVSPDGLNLNLERWNLTTIPLRSSVAGGVEVTLSGLNGEWFFWTPPNGVAGKFRLDSDVTRSYIGVNSQTLSFTFKRVYVP